MGLDAYNPLEAKAGLDVVDLRRKLRPPHGILRQHGRAGLGQRAAGRAAADACCAS